MQFHPSNRFLASCSSDCTVRLFDLTSSTRRAQKMLSDAVPVHAIEFHPTGDYLLAATTHPVLRLYDLTSGACYRSRDDNAQHTAALNAVSHARDATQFATASDDGSVKLWDGVSLKCVATLTAAHRGVAVLSVRFSRSGRYLLTSASDASTTIWDIATMQPLVQIVAPPTLATPSATVGVVVAATPQQPSLNVGRAASPTASHGACWSHDERLVFVPGVAGAISARIYATRTGVQCGSLVGHGGVVCCVDASPVESLVASGSGDCRARIWNIVEATLSGGAATVVGGAGVASLF